MRVSEMWHLLPAITSCVKFRKTNPEEADVTTETLLHAGLREEGAVTDPEMF